MCPNETKLEREKGSSSSCGRNAHDEQEAKIGKDLRYTACVRRLQLRRINARGCTHHSLDLSILPRT